MRRKSASFLRLAGLLAMATMLGGCYVVYGTGMEFVYRKEVLPAERIVADVAYWDHPQADPQKHRLDRRNTTPGLSL